LAVQRKEQGEGEGEADGIRNRSKLGPNPKSRATQGISAFRYRRILSRTGNKNLCYGKQPTANEQVVKEV